MKVLVTGAAGFLGSHLVDALLARGDRVVAYDHRLEGKCLSPEVLSKIDAIEADIFDGDRVTTAASGCAAIFHCAAMVGVDFYNTKPAKTMETEEVGLRNVCQAARANRDVIVVYASSSAVYGVGGSALLREDEAVTPTSNYGISKRYNELYLAAQFAEHGLRSAALRIFNVYGPRQDVRLVIPRFIRDAAANVPIQIFGSGRQTRDFVYVGDVVEAALGCVSAGVSSDIINVCSGRDTSIADLAGRIVALMGSQSEITTQDTPSGRSAFEIDRSIGDRRKLEKLTAQAPVLLDEGLKLTIAAALHGTSTPKLT